MGTRLTFSWEVTLYVMIFVALMCLQAPILVRLYAVYEVPISTQLVMDLYYFGLSHRWWPLALLGGIGMCGWLEFRGLLPQQALFRSGVKTLLSVIICLCIVFLAIPSFWGPDLR